MTNKKIIKFRLMSTGAYLRIHDWQPLRQANNNWALSLIYNFHDMTTAERQAAISGQ